MHRVAYAAGQDLQGDVRDPQFAWRKDAARGFVEVKLQPERAVWRDSASLLRLAPGNQEISAPGACEQAATLVRQTSIPPAMRLVVDVLGLSGDKAKVRLWRHERLPLPLVLLKDEELAEEVIEALAEGEAASQALRNALFRLVKFVLSPAADQQQGRQPRTKEDIRPVVRALGAEPVYWSRLGAAFERLLVTVPSGAGEAHAAWRKAVRKAAREAFGQATGALGDTARVLKASSLAEITLLAGLRETVPADEEEEAA